MKFQFLGLLALSTLSAANASEYNCRVDDYYYRDHQTHEFTLKFYDQSKLLRLSANAQIIHSDYSRGYTSTPVRKANSQVLVGDSNLTGHVTPVLSNILQAGSTHNELAFFIITVPRSLESIRIAAQPSKDGTYKLAIGRGDVAHASTKINLGAGTIFLSAPELSMEIECQLKEDKKILLNALPVEVTPTEAGPAPCNLENGDHCFGATPSTPEELESMPPAPALE